MAYNLTARQREFCRQYLISSSAAKAYEAAYGRKNYSDKNLAVQGCKQMANPKVRQELDRLRLAAGARADITVDRVMQEYARIAFVDIADCFDESGNLKPIKDLPEDARRAISGIDVEEATENRGRVRKVRLSDKRAALDSLAKILGMFQEPENKGGGTTFVLQVMPAGHDQRPAVEIQPELEPGSVRAVVRRL